MDAPPSDGGDSPRSKLAEELAAEVMRQLRDASMPTFHKGAFHTGAKRPSAAKAAGRPKKARPPTHGSALASAAAPTPAPAGMSGLAALALPSGRPGAVVPYKPVAHATAVLHPHLAPAAQHAPPRGLPPRPRPPLPPRPPPALPTEQQFLDANTKLLQQVTRAVMDAALYRTAAGQGASGATAPPVQLLPAAAAAAAAALVATPRQSSGSQPASPLGTWQQPPSPVGTWQQPASAWQQPAPAVGAWQQPASGPALLRPATAEPGAQAAPSGGDAAQSDLIFRQALARHVGCTMLESAAQRAAAELERLLVAPTPSPGTLQLVAAAAAAPPSAMPAALAAFDSLRIPLPPRPPSTGR